MSLYLLHIQHIYGDQHHPFWDETPSYFVLSEQTDEELADSYYDLDIADMAGIDDFDFDKEDRLEITTINILDLSTIRKEGDDGGMLDGYCAVRSFR